MRITDEDKKNNRDKIVKTAARLFRERGFDGVGIADIMKAAGFTHGGFYNHFKSKDELASAAVRDGFEVIKEETQGKSLDAILGRYISHEHCDDLSRGCIAPALGSDAARQSNLTKTAFAEGVESWISLFEEALSKEKNESPVQQRRAAIKYFAEAVGAIMLARACPNNSPLQDEILEACSLEKVSRKKSS